MPRRSAPDALAAKVGARIRQLRLDAGLTQEKLAYESEVGSKGYMSDIEKGLARPTLGTLLVIAEHLGVEVLDLVTFPDESPRQRLVDLTRKMKPGTVKRLVREAAEQ